MKRTNATLKFDEDGVSVEVTAQSIDTMRKFLENSETRDITADAVCPFCGEEMTSLDGEVDAGDFYDDYTCTDCECGVTYISPNKYGEYWEVVANGALTVRIDLRTVEFSIEDSE